MLYLDKQKKYAEMAKASSAKTWSATHKPYEWVKTPEKQRKTTTRGDRDD